MSTIQEVDASVDVMKSLLWHYNDAVRLQKIVQLKQLWYNSNQSSFWGDWIRDVFDLRTANDFGLSVWAIILDVPLSFSAPPSDVSKIGWGFGPQRKNFSNGNFKRRSGGGVSLTLEQKRIVLRLRYFQLTTSGNVLQINKFLLYLFGETDGLVYVRDNRNMTCTYIFSFFPPSQLQLLLDEFDLMPRPAGVAFDYTTDLLDAFGYGEFRANYDNGNFYNFALPPVPPGSHSLHLGTDGTDYGMSIDGLLWVGGFGSITPSYVPSGTLSAFNIAALATFSSTTLYLILAGVQDQYFLTQLDVAGLGDITLDPGAASYAVINVGAEWYTSWNWGLSNMGNWPTLGNRQVDFTYNVDYQTDATSKAFSFYQDAPYSWTGWPGAGDILVAQGGKMDIYVASSSFSSLWPSTGGFGDPAIFGRHNGVGLGRLVLTVDGSVWVLLALSNSDGTENYRLDSPCLATPLDTVDATYHDISDDANWGLYAYGWNVTTLGWGGSGFDTFTLTNLD
jgi:hypothetical protein